MATKIKRDIEKLLRKGLTGWEAGLLVFEDSWLAERNLGAFLSDKDVERIKSGLRSQQDIRDYNTLIRLFRTADYIESRAFEGVQVATALLERIAGVGFLTFAPYMAKMLLSHLPLPVTEKQFQDLKAEQKQKKLKTYYCLDQVISERAYYQAPEGLQKDLEPESIELDAPELYQQAKEEIAALIESGQLPQPVKLDIQAWDELVRDGQREDVSFWAGNSEWTPEQAERLLQHYLPGEALYKARLPEWLVEIDTFDLYRLPEALWLGHDPPPCVAIIQDPDQLRLDERGYYDLELIKRWPLSPWPLSESQRQWPEWARLVIETLKKVLARRQVLEELSYVLGLALYENLDMAIDTFLKPALGRYNLFAKTISPEHEKPGWGADLSPAEFRNALDQVEDTLGNRMAMAHEDLRLPPIQLARLKPQAKSLAELRGWISEQLGAGWWSGRYQAKEPRSLLPKDSYDRWQEVIKGDQEREAQLEEVRRELQKRRADFLRMAAQC